MDEPRKIYADFEGRSLSAMELGTAVHLLIMEGDHVHSDDPPAPIPPGQHLFDADILAAAKKLGIEGKFQVLTKEEADEAISAGEKIVVVVRDPHYARMPNPAELLKAAVAKGMVHKAVDITRRPKLKNRKGGK